MDGFTLFKFLHIATMFTAVAGTVFPEVILHLIANTREPRTIATVAHIAERIGKVIPIFFVGGAVFGLLAAWTGERGYRYNERDGQALARSMECWQPFPDTVPALRADAELAAEWEPRLTSSVYDQGDQPAANKRGALAGMAMTEKQGGSDVRANTTWAASGDGGF